MTLSPPAYLRKLELQKHRSYNPPKLRQFFFLNFTGHRRWKRMVVTRRCETPECQVTWVVKVYSVAPKVDGFSEWNLLIVTILAPRILRCFVEFWQIWHTHIHARTHGMTPGRGMGSSHIFLPDNTPANPPLSHWGQPMRIWFRFYFHTSYSITFHIPDEPTLILLVLLNQPITNLLVMNLKITMEIYRGHPDVLYIV
jgi:hypothetical protein